MAKKEHYLITRLKKLRPVFNAFFSRTATTKAALPVINVSVANIIKDAQAIQNAIRHIEEGYFDSQELSNEFAHLAQFGINLETTIEHDGGFWGYALSVVDRHTFREGAEYCDLEQLQNLTNIIDEVMVVKLAIRDRKLVNIEVGELKEASPPLAPHASGRPKGRGAPLGGVGTDPDSTGQPGIGK